MKCRNYRRVSKGIRGYRKEGLTISEFEKYLHLKSNKFCIFSILLDNELVFATLAVTIDVVGEYLQYVPVSVL